MLFTAQFTRQQLPLGRPPRTVYFLENGEETILMDLTLVCM